MNSSLLEGTIAVIAGNFVGAISDRVVTIIDARVRMLESLQLGERTGSLLDSILGVFLHMGLITLGTGIIVESMPWMVQNPSAFTLFGMAVASTSPHLDNHLKILNSILFDEALYTAEAQRQKAFIVNGPKPTEETAPDS
jgi:hypothetical protein